ncbi:MAG: uracil-DNA glycosylase [Planctomycetota bacterium]
MTQRSAADRTVTAHLEALASWGIQRVRFVPAVDKTEERLPESAGDGAPAPAPGPTALTPSGHTPAGLRPPAVALETSAKPGETEALAACETEVASCERCALAKTRTQTVFGVGNPAARLMFVGEAPGRDEDAQGEPFVGKAGQLLDKIIVALGLRREDVYIANVLKCRPPGNRDPQPQEVGSCTPYLERQIDLIAPEMIVALGKPAANYLLDTTEFLGRLRGRTHEYRGIPVVATYHPAYLLRNPAEKKKVWQDLQMVIRALDLTPVTGR